jgi:carbonic anhydrase/acetyltransferase-like protein (isoleucine patch superfamily)
VLLHACEVQDGAFVGMHSTVLDGAVIESEAMVAAGALIPPGKIVRRGELWAGNPGRKLRDLTEKDYETFERIAADCGFGSAVNLRRVFQRHLGIAPRDYVERFGRI